MVQSLVIHPKLRWSLIIILLELKVFCIANAWALLLLDLIGEELIVEAHLFLVLIIIIYLIPSLLFLTLFDLVALHLDALDFVLRVRFIALIVSSMPLLYGARRVSPISLSLWSAHFRNIFFCVGIEHIRLLVLVRNFVFGDALGSSFVTLLLNTELLLQIEALAVDQPLVSWFVRVVAMSDGPGHRVLIFSVLEDWLGVVRHRVTLP